MIDAYYDDEWHQTLDPLYDKFQLCRSGELSHDEMDEAIHETHKSCQDVYNLFTTKRDLLEGLFHAHPLLSIQKIDVSFMTVYRLQFHYHLVD